MGSLDRINNLAYQAAIDLAASSPRADYTPGQLPALPLPVQMTDDLIVWRNAAGQTFQCTVAQLAAILSNTFPTTNPVYATGRLTLTSNTPVMIADVTATSTVFYTPYLPGNTIAIQGAAGFAVTSFAQLTLTLTAAQNISGSVYDIFAYVGVGGLTIGTGPAWTSTTNRGTGLGTTQILQVNGMWVNQNAITAFNNSVSTVVAAGLATYLGSVYCTANGQTTVNIAPAPTSPGSNNVVGLYNGYNRVAFKTLEGSFNATGAASAMTWAPVNANAIITFLDGLQQSPLYVSVNGDIRVATSFEGRIGISLDSSSSPPSRGAIADFSNGGTTSSTNLTISVETNFPPVLGLHQLFSMTWANSNSSTNVQYNTVVGNQLILQYEN